MRRSGFLYVTGCAKQRFVNYGHRDKLPFSKSRGLWTDYSLSNAFNLRLMTEAIDQARCDVETALYLVGNSLHHLPMHPLDYPSSMGDIWVAAVKVTAEEKDAPEPYWRFTVAGRLGDIPGLVVDRLAREFTGSRVAAVISVNASAAADRVRLKAQELGLPEGDDFSPVWAEWEWPHWVDRAALAQVRGAA